MAPLALELLDNMGLTVNVTQGADGTWSATTGDARGIGNLRVALNAVTVM